MKTCVIYVDGASRGNPGAAGIGISLQDPAGAELATVSRPLGRTTNNRAEYTALVEALKLAKEQQFEGVEIRADSQLMVRQMTGQYQIRDQFLKGLWEEAQRLSKQFSSFVIAHIPRDENDRADELANQALDQPA
jgi:ribonuclease HI